MAEAELHAVARGQVQGVYFRQFVQEQAQALGLTGWVRNREDGISVELVARGERASLGRLLELVRLGPPDALVRDLEVEWREPGTEALHGFAIVR